MINLNIDDLVPTYEGYDKVRHKGLKLARNTFWIRTHTPSYYSPELSVGIKQENILNWRMLEKRQFELTQKVDEAYRLFWQTMIDAGGAVEKDVVKYIVYGERAYKFHDGCYSHESAVRLAEDCLKYNGTNRQEKFVLVTKDNGGTRIRQLDLRYRFFASCLGTYRRAFQRAVEDRLKVFLDTDEARVNPNAGSRWSHYRKSFVFIIENEGRSYILTSDEMGTVKWLVGDFIRLTPQEKEV